MRLTTALAFALVAGLTAVPAARACDPVRTECLPRIVVFPAYTPEGLRVGTVQAPVRPIVRLERSRATGAPLPVLFNNPGLLPGSVSPELELVPLPHAKPYKTQAVYPRGY